MTLANCLELPEPPEPIRVDIPNFGAIEAARQSLYDLPDLSSYIMRLQDVAATALAPLRRMLEMVQVVVSIKDCILAIPKAVGSLSPSPVLNCLDDLREAFAIITAYIPPFPYFAALEDVADYVAQMVEEIFALFTVLDDKISTQKDTLAEALELGDLELAAIANCVTNEVTPLVINTFDALKFAAPLIGTMLEPIAALTGNSSLKAAAAQISQLPDTLEQIKNSIEGTEGVPVLDGMITAMVVLRDAAVNIANIAGGLHGGNSSRALTVRPIYENF